MARINRQLGRLFIDIFYVGENITNLWVEKQRPSTHHLGPLIRVEHFELLLHGIQSVLNDLLEEG